ncbi:Gp37 family protein [Samsonia erythrinae]|uniref:Gp37 protein n=1 Tax=Samsonia erythrinae TaxID=160434 RepID=A0A4R3VVC0_9GAMM|nr:Gp37 family protein [Samsonia erythrinae]TCV09307.1 Gp37 protein [Samsonia erythrinae]
MNTKPLIDAVIAHLQQRLPARRIVPYPEHLQTTGGGAQGDVLVGYRGSEFSAPEDVHSPVQTQRPQLMVAVLLPELDGEDGVLATLDILRQTLGGYRLPDCHRGIRLIRDRYVGYTEGRWHYAIDCTTETLFIEDRELTDGPLLTTVNYEEKDA